MKQFYELYKDNEKVSTVNTVDTIELVKSFENNVGL